MKKCVFTLKNSLTVDHIRCEAGFTELRGGLASDWGDGSGVGDIGLPLRRRRRRRRKELFTTICQKKIAAALLRCSSDRNDGIQYQDTRRNKKEDFRIIAV